MCVSCASRCVAHMQTAQELARQESGKTLRAAGTALHSHCAHLIALTRKKTNGAAVGTARSTPLHPHAGSARGFRRSQHRAQSGTRTRTPTLAGRWNTTCLMHSRTHAYQRMQSEGGLDDKVEDLIKEARTHGIPVVFALSRSRLGKALGKSMRMSAAYASSSPHPLPVPCPCFFRALSRPSLLCACAWMSE